MTWTHRAIQNKQRERERDALDETNAETPISHDPDGGSSSRRYFYFQTGHIRCDRPGGGFIGEIRMISFRDGEKTKSSSQSREKRLRRKPRENRVKSRNITFYRESRWRASELTDEKSHKGRRGVNRRGSLCKEVKVRQKNTHLVCILIELIDYSK